MLKEIEDSNGEIILFIDELHTLVGAGAAEATSDGREQHGEARAGSRRSAAIGAT